jgi:NADPH:quinone reductase-like Zn-dependent oxidoreductase
MRAVWITRPAGPRALEVRETAGVIDALGAGTQGCTVGQRVLALTRFGGHADVVCVPAGQVLPMPVTYLTAYHMLFRVANVRPGERVLVHMAAAGSGRTASPAKHSALKAEGCTYPIDCLRSS